MISLFPRLFCLTTWLFSHQCSSLWVLTQQWAFALLKKTLSFFCFEELERLRNLRLQGWPSKIHSRFASPGTNFVMQWLSFKDTWSWKAWKTSKLTWILHYQLSGTRTNSVVWIIVLLFKMHLECTKSKSIAGAKNLFSVYGLRDECCIGWSFRRSRQSYFIISFRYEKSSLWIMPDFYHRCFYDADRKTSYEVPGN